MSKAGDLASLRQRYLEQRPHWKAVAKAVEEQLWVAVRAAGVSAHVSSRPKEVPRLLRKAVMKRRVHDLGLIRDKAAARVTVQREDHIERVAERIDAETDLEVREVEDKLEGLAPREFDYRGLHLDVVLPRAQLPEAPDALGELWCEVQVRTAAQTLWADTAHPLYKLSEGAPRSALRTLYRLAAVMEIYDGEIARAYEEISASDGYPPVRLLLGLQDLFYGLTAVRPPDDEISLAVIKVLLPLYGDLSPEQVLERLEGFVTEERDHLSWVYNHYADADDKLLLYQPESLMVFERLEHDPHMLRDGWDEELSDEFLLQLTDAWRRVPLDRE